MSLGRRQLLLGGMTALPGVAAAQMAPPVAVAKQAATLADQVSTGFTRTVIARWGDAVLPNAPAFTPFPLDRMQADAQFPWDAVFAGLIAPPAAQDGIARLVAVIANPTAPARYVFPGGGDIPAVAGALQGATIMNLQYQGGAWLSVDGGYQTRRLSDGTLCEISGPVSGNIGTSVQGLLAPAAGCATPWGTSLLAEGDTNAWLTRLAGTGYGYADPANGPRYGWVAEVNALDPGSFPVKRTALGRFMRTGIATTATPDGRAVIFMSSAAGYLFRFIAATAATDGTALDSGTLAVAQITATGLSWADLGTDIPTLAATASAAAAAKGSLFDAPAGIAIAPQNSAIYLACRGNPARGAPDALNPRAGNDNGHIVVLTPPAGDVTARTFGGLVAIAAGNPATAAGTKYTAGSDAWLRKPATLNLDSTGQLWIGTDQGGDTASTADGLFIMQTGGPSLYMITTAYLAPVGAAIGGCGFDSATHTIFAAIRHPGATPTGSFDNPATRWPTLQPAMPPQTTLIALIQA
jgi:secreted PhoX family phosphatase